MTCLSQPGPSARGAGAFLLYYCKITFIVGTQHARCREDRYGGGRAASRLDLQCSRDRFAVLSDTRAWLGGSYPSRLTWDGRDPPLRPFRWGTRCHVRDERYGTREAIAVTVTPLRPLRWGPRRHLRSDVDPPRAASTHQFDVCIRYFLEYI